LALDVLARRSGLHPETVRRLVQLGLVQPSGGSSSAPLFRPQDAQLLARAARLRRDLGVNYAGAVLACELLARIEQLEERDGGGVPRPRQQEVIAWTQTV
jgi:DNA-binding transcriptional MerR regulator